ncbi:MAG: hemolysin family protein [Gammaproteobacteria bacterium]|nr:hemolysin family protein [Gammaproteobacteria bacterium]
MMSLLITYFLIAICTSFLCSLWEAVLLSITPSYAQIKLEEGTVLGKRLKKFKQNIDRPLAAILTLNTIAHTIGAIGVGEQATLIWAESNPLITGLVVPVAMTLGILILSEIIPKTIGANFWKELAPFTVASLRVIIFLLWPLVWFSQLITRLLKKDKEASIFSRSDFVAMAEIGAKQGVFERGETEIINNLLRFDSVRARDVMTPRPVVKVISEEITLREFYESNRDFRFSRIPVYKGESQEDITGFVRKDELLRHLVEDQGDTTVGSIKRDMLVVHESAPIPDLFNRFLEQREHIALVVDEFGGMSGIVTMEDVIETLLGMEIVDELDNAADMQHLARQQWEERAQRLGLLDDLERED